MVASAGPRAASRASFERAPTGPPPEEWRGGIRTSRGRAHGAPFHAGPRLGRGTVAQGRVQAPPVVQLDARTPTVRRRSAMVRSRTLGIRGRGGPYASTR